MVRLEKGSVLVDGNCSVMNMSREKAEEGLDVSKRREHARSVCVLTYERISEATEPKPRNLV